MKKLILSMCLVFSFSPVSAGILDRVAQRVAEFGRWDPDGVQKLLVEENKLIDEQIKFLEGKTQIDLENTQLVKSKKSYELTPDEIAAQLQIHAIGTLIKLVERAMPNVINRLKKQKELNEKLISKGMRMLTDYHLQVKVVKLLRKIDELNKKMLESMKSDKKLTAFVNLIRKGERGRTKSKVMLALGFNKKEALSMLIHSEPNLTGDEKEHQRELSNSIKTAGKEASL